VRVGRRDWGLFAHLSFVLGGCTCVRGWVCLLRYPLLLLLLLLLRDLQRLLLLVGHDLFKLGVYLLEETHGRLRVGYTGMDTALKIVGIPEHFRH
jgi:hypothetical protein